MKYQPWSLSEILVAYRFFYSPEGVQGFSKDLVLKARAA